MFLNFTLNFREHFDNVLHKVNKTAGILRKLQSILPGPSLLTIYNLFIRPNLDYGGIIIIKRVNSVKV